MGDYSMFMDPIDDIDCKKNFMRDTVSCDLDVNNAVRARIVGKNKGRFLSLSLSYPDFTLKHEPVTLLERCNKKIT